MRVARACQEAYWDTLGHENINSRQFNSRVFELYRSNMHGWGTKQVLDGNLNVTGTLSLSAMAEATEKRYIEAESADALEAPQPQQEAEKPEKEREETKD